MCLLISQGQTPEAGSCSGASHTSFVGAGKNCSSSVSLASTQQQVVGSRQQGGRQQARVALSIPQLPADADADADAGADADADTDADTAADSELARAGDWSRKRRSRSGTRSLEGRFLSHDPPGHSAQER
eukprot:6172851-Pleurochrysis_carterae.AAC.1